MATPSWSVDVITSRTSSSTDSVTGIPFSVQLRPDHHQRLLPPEQRFAVHVDPGCQRVLLRLVLEVVQRAEVAVLQDDGLPLRRVGERHHDVALVVGRVFPPAKPDRGLGQFAILFIQHREHVTGRGGADQMPQLALADHGPAALAVADEVDHVDARLRQLRELKMPAHAPQRRLRILVGLFLVGHQPIEVDVRVDVRLVLAIEVGRVDLVDLDD